METFGDRLKKAMQEKGLTDQAVADKLTERGVRARNGRPIPYQTIQAIRSGTVKTTTYAAQIAEAIERPDILSATQRPVETRADRIAHKVAKMPEDIQEQVEWLVDTISRMRHPTAAAFEETLKKASGKRRKASKS